MTGRTDNSAHSLRRRNRPAGRRFLLCPFFSLLPLIGLASVLGLPASAAASPHEARIRLKQGKVPLGEVSAAVCRELHVKPVRLPAGDLDLNGLKGSDFVAAVNGSLGEGLRVSVTPDVLVVHVDPERLPKDRNAAKRALRVFTALEAPEATAAQRRHYGLHFFDDTGAAVPADRLDPRKPVVILIHGLDSDTGVWGPMQGLLRRQGYTVATFGYPADGPIEESAELLRENLVPLHKAHPNLRIDIVAHSMGGLVARAYVEGDDYAGGIDRLIMLAPPNHGSSWSRWRWFLGVWEQFRQHRTDPDWSVTWMITDGLGEAGDDLKPKSKFLKRLNANRRRRGVRYTIVAGNQHPACRIGAEWVTCTSHLIPRRAGTWWGVRQCKAKLVQEADCLAHRTGKDDGVVTLKSARLDGVGDFVVLPADHITIALGDAPSAWGTIRDRLAR